MEHKPKKYFKLWGKACVAFSILIALSPVFAQQSAGASEADHPFYTILDVITSPRCLNCHPTDDQPRQTDAQIEHLFGVVRGEDNHGDAVLHCDSCHHEENNTYSKVPGAPHWGLAPKSMGWLGLSDAEIARSLVDTTKNGGRDAAALVHHMSHDALVLWAWDAGEGREPPPVAFDEFVEALNAWLEQGAELPEVFKGEDANGVEGEADGSN